jgi:uncharacterized membrane protein
MQSVETQGQRRGVRLLASVPAVATLERLIPVVYLAIGLPVMAYLCFLIPPIQGRDEGRHFLRACQIADGGILAQIDANTGQAGGMLPVAEAEFVRDKMSTDFLRREDLLPTIGERLKALDAASQSQAPLNERRFAAFAGATIYPPALYLPLVAGIRLAQVFSDKVYVWFYTARLLNGLTAVLLIFAALQIARTHQLLLVIPAVLPMSLLSISSISSDAQIVALSILFVALCIRFLGDDGLAIRAGLALCLGLLTLGKPVHIAAGALLLAAYGRLGWRRAAAFCAGVMALALGAYIGWAYLVRPFFAVSAQGFHGNHNPAMQIGFIKAHPILAAEVFPRTLWHQGRDIFKDFIGNIGWGGLPFPPLVYKASVGIGLAILCCVAVNLDRRDLASSALAGLGAGGFLFAVLLAGFVLWTAVGAPQVDRIQGRYLLPGLALLIFGSPPLKRFRGLTRYLLPALTFVFVLLSCVWTLRIVSHYYFSSSSLLGKNIRALYYEADSQWCPASPDDEMADWFAVVESGRATAHNQNYRILLSEDDGTILGESDPVLMGGNGSRWRLRIWQPLCVRVPAQCIVSGGRHLWYAAGKSACHFADIKVLPDPIPPA